MTSDTDNSPKGRLLSDEEAEQTVIGLDPKLLDQVTSLPQSTAAELQNIAAAQQGDAQKKTALLKPLQAYVWQIAAKYGNHQVSADELERLGNAALEQAFTDFTPELNLEFNFFAKTQVLGVITHRSKGETVNLKSGIIYALKEGNNYAKRQETSN